MWNWPNILTGIGTIIMAIAVCVTARIAIVTLIGGSEQRKGKNSEKLLRQWYSNEYGNYLQKLYDFANEYIYCDTMKNATSIEVIKKEIEITDSIEKIKNFFRKIKYSLDYKKIDLENLRFDFSEIFFIDDQESFPQLYDMLKRFDIRYGHQNRFEKENTIDNLFLLIAKKYNYSDLLKKIENQEVGYVFKK